MISSAYSRLGRFFHEIVLNGVVLGEISFDLEKFFFQNAASCQGSVYVTGLARAGTTALMRALYESNQFASLTYDDMPFVLSPNLWGRLSRLRARQRELKERAHGDGVYIDFDSPEALEEVFWRVHCGQDYIFDHELRTHEVLPDVLEQLSIYRGMVCHKYGRQRYLAKNNNLILRLDSILRQSEEGIFLVLFRDPIAQAESLLEQHKKFLASDAFARRYMIWLVHHEFGGSHRPFRFPNTSSSFGESMTVEYWIQRWVDAYAYLLPLLRSNSGRLIAVSYERLCDNSSYWLGLCEKINVPRMAREFRVIKRRCARPGGRVVDSAFELYHALSDLA